MNYMRGKASLEKEEIFNKITSGKKCSSMNRFTAGCSCLNHRNKTDGQHKMKKLKSRKERNRMRGCGKKTFMSQSHHCHRQSSKDTTQAHSCRHGTIHFHSGRGASFASVAPAAHEQSIITDSRLIGHQGLFSHEVKSIDIERLLSEQRKLEKSAGQVGEKSNSAAHLPRSTSNNRFPLSVSDLRDTDSDGAVPVGQKDLISKAQDDFCEKEKTSQGSELTPGQRPPPQLDLSGNHKGVLSSKRGSIDLTSIKSAIPEKGEESQQAPIVGRENVKNLSKKGKRLSVSTLKDGPKNQESPLIQTQNCVLSPSTPRFSNSNTDMQRRGQDPDHTAQSISALAASLCDCLKFPLLKRRCLVTESREVLLRALQESHGPRLQENLLKVQQCLGLSDDPAEEVHGLEPTRMDDDELLLTDPFTTANTAVMSRFDSQRSTFFQMKRDGHFKWQSSLHQQQKKQTVEWTSPVNYSAILPDETQRSTHSPQFCMDFGLTAEDHWLVPPPSSWWREKASVCKTPKIQKDVVSFGDGFINHSGDVTRGSSGSRFRDGSIHSFFPHQSELLDGESLGPTLYSPEKGSFGIDRFSSHPPFSAQIHRPQQRRRFEPFSQFRLPSTDPSLSSNHISMTHFPPSHTLERDPAIPLPSFPSPDHWSFPPMRLY